MTPGRFRALMAALIVAFAGVIIAVVALNPRAEPSALPDPLEAVFPLPDDVVVRQTAIEVDLPVGYEAIITVDGRAVPPVEVGFVPETGVYTWQPGPGLSMEVWPPGEHTITVEWDRRAGGRPDPGSFTWTFRVS